ncbi:hypothetical protein Tco_0921097 [Tanacetum coccineum]
MVSLEKNQTCSLVRARKKASQSLRMFNVKEEQNIISERYKGPLIIIVAESSYVGALNDTSTQDVHQVSDEREVKVMRSFNWPLSELIIEDDVLPDRGYSQTVGAVALLNGRWFDVYRDYLRRRAVK